MSGYRIDYGVPFLVNDLGQIVGYVDNTGKEQSAGFGGAAPQDTQSATRIAELSAAGLSKMAMYLPVSDNVVRNSANDATDANETTLATIVVPPNNGATRGTIFEFWSAWETTNSANSKNGIARIGGASVGNPMGIGAGVQAQTQRQPFHWYDANTLITLNNGGSSGAGQSSSLLLTVSVPGMANAGFTLVYSCSWSTQPIPGEFIRLKMARVLQINP